MPSVNQASDQPAEPPLAGAGIAASGGGPAVPVSAESPVFEVMATMRAMHRLRPDPLPDELLGRLVEAATWAPSASNAQAYSFVVVTDRAQMTRLAVLRRRCVDTHLNSPGTNRLAPEHMDKASWDRMDEAIAYQRDHFEEPPALIIPCYAYPRPGTRSMAGMSMAGVASLGPVGLARLALRLPRLALLGEAASVYPGVQNLLLAARALGLAANITIWHLFLEQEWKTALGIPTGSARSPSSRSAGHSGASARYAAARQRSSFTATIGSTLLRFVAVELGSPHPRGTGAIETAVSWPAHRSTDAQSAYCMRPLRRPGSALPSPLTQRDGARTDQWLSHATCRGGISRCVTGPAQSSSPGALGVGVLARPASPAGG